MNKSRHKIQKRIQQQKAELKRRLVSELAISIDDLKQEVEPWIEIVDGKEYILTKIENITQFGVITFIFKEKKQFGEGEEIRLPFALQGQ